MKPIKRKAGKYSWQVWVPPGYADVPKRKVYYFESKEKASAFCDELASWRIRRKGEEVARALTSTEINWLGYLKQEVGDLARLPGIVELWKRTAALNPATISELCEQWYAWQDEKKLNVRTLAGDIRPKLRDFCAIHGATQANAITPADVSRYLIGIPGTWTRKGHHKWLKTMFEWAQEQRMIADNPFNGIKAPPKILSVPKVYTPADALKLLLACDSPGLGDLMPWLVLSGWNFCRTCELIPSYAGDPVLQWSDFLLDHDQPLLYIRPEVAKQTRRDSGSPRYIPVTPAAAYWLEPYVKKTGPVVDLTARRYNETKKKLFTAAGLHAIDNGLRHSCLSYWIAQDPSNGVATTAKYAGNSEAISRQHYIQALTPAIGKIWWNLKRETKIEELSGSKRQLGAAS